MGGYKLHSFLKQDGDDDADAACEMETNEIYGDWNFMMTLVKIHAQCSAQFEFDSESFSMTNDFTNCDEEGTFDTACATASGSPMAIPDIYVGCTLTTDEQSYTSSYNMIGAAVCLGSPCSQEADEEEVDQSEQEMETEMEAEMEKYLGIFNIEGDVECEVNIGRTQHPLIPSLLTPPQLEWKPSEVS